MRVVYRVLQWELTRRVLVKQILGFKMIIITYCEVGGDFQTIRLHLAVASRYCFENDWWCP